MKAKTILFYIFLVLTSLGLVFAGIIKFFPDLMGPDAPPPPVKLEPWFMMMIGAFEILGGIGLWLPKFRTCAALCSLAIMFGAIGVHVGSSTFVDVGGAAGFAIDLMLIMALDPVNKLVIARKEA
jgi:uncharacterized membrane protein YphA (DoxX/SURF4 family)